MILYFADRQMNILGQASTSLPQGLKVTEDVRTEDVSLGVVIFECKIPYDADTRAKVAACTEVGNYLLRAYEDRNELFSIIETETDTKKQAVYIYAEDAGMDLLNEVVPAYEADKAYPISHYINKYASNSGFQIGRNEVASLTRKLSWDGEATASERIISIATQFDNCELSFSFEVDGLYVTKKLINIYKKRGQDNGVQLRLNKELDSIVTTKSIANLATALQCVGGTPDPVEDEETGESVEQPPVTLKGYKYDDGDFYADGDVLKSREALKTWARLLWKDDGTQKAGGHITKQYSYDTLSQQTLCNRAIAELKKLREIEVNYEINFEQLPDNVRVGDRVNIVDDAGELYLSTRILLIETSEADKYSKATLGEYLIKSAGISQKVADLANEFSAKAAVIAEARRAAEAAKAAAAEASKTAEDAKDGINSAQAAADAATEAANRAETEAQLAKAAAEAVEVELDELEIGGRNLLRWTQDLPIVDEAISPDGISLFSLSAGTLEETEDGAKLIFASNAQVGMTIPLVYDGCIEDRETVTLSFDYRGNITTPGKIYFLQRTTPNVSLDLSNYAEMVANETEWQHFTATFQSNYANTRVNYQILLFYGLGDYTADNWVEIKAKTLKLEKGNKATDWTPAPEDIDNDIQGVNNKLHGEISNQNTSITKSCEAIILSALTEYTRTGDFESFKDTVSAQLAVLSDEIIMRFGETTERVAAVDGDMQSKFSELYNYIQFSEEGIYISEKTGLSLELAGGVISFKRNGQQFGWWDGSDFYTGNIVVQVNERAQFGNFAFVPRSDGSLMFLKVGG